jgi:hypothetical protein
MFHKTFSVCLLLMLVLANFQTAMAQKGSWEAVKNLVRRDAAVQKSDGETLFGRLNSVNDNEIVIHTADKKDFTNTLLTIPCNNVKKVWSADLRFGDRNTAKGAAIGFGYLLANRKSGDGQTSLAVPVFGLYGTGIGAAAGFFTKNKHKKEVLVYEK